MHHGSYVKNDVPSTQILDEKWRSSGIIVTKAAQEKALARKSISCLVGHDPMSPTVSECSWQQTHGKHFSVIIGF